MFLVFKYGQDSCYGPQEQVFVCEYKFFLLKYLWVEWLGHMVALLFKFQNPTKLFSKLCPCVHLCPTLCDPMSCSPTGSSVNGILQERILEWGAISYSQEIFPEIQHLLHLLNWADGFFTTSSTWETQVIAPFYIPSAGYESFSSSTILSMVSLSNRCVAWTSCSLDFYLKIVNYFQLLFVYLFAISIYLLVKCHVYSFDLFWLGYLFPYWIWRVSSIFWI